MSDFKKLKEAVRKQFDKIASRKLFVVSLDKEVLWNLYLDSFPPGTNGIYKARREFDCNSCKSFVKRVGNVVAITEGLELETVWDVATTPAFQPVVDALAAFVKRHPIQNVLLSVEPVAGVDVTRHPGPGGMVVTWEHFFAKLPKECVHTSKSESVESVLGKRAADHQVFSRSMEELTLEAGETVLELIDSNSLYRGEEHKNAIMEFIKEKKAFEAVAPDRRGLHCWTRLGKTAVARIRNNAIGTMLVDLSNGVGLDTAVAKFDKVMAPSNYKRSKGVYTQKQAEALAAKIRELGYEDSLGRRHATIDDITVNNVLFIDRSAKKELGALDMLKADAGVDPRKFGKVEEIGIDDFVANVLPHARTLEILPETRLQGNLMSLIAPVNKHAPSMFKWGNGFGWSYNGDLADSMKQRVKDAGGRVEGALRFSIQWNEDGDNGNDYDAHCVTPSGFRIYFPTGQKVHRPTGGNLDVDIRYPEGVAVENIIFPDEHKLEEGVYQFFVHCYAHRGGTSGFRAEIEFDGEIRSFAHDRDIKQGDFVAVSEVRYSKKKGFELVKSMDSTVSVRTMWGVKTGNFAKVTALMMSPNHWDGQTGKGNRHFFFIMEGCKAEGTARPFFNEFLNEELTPHRQALEALGAKMRVADSDDQMSGFGFSSTARDTVTVRVTGNVSRILKIGF